jgi:hypothetical protein
VERLLPVPPRLPALLVPPHPVPLRLPVLLVPPHLLRPLPPALKFLSK